MRYRGQSFEIDTTLDPAAIEAGDSAALAGAFHREHERIYGHADAGAPIQIDQPAAGDFREDGQARDSPATAGSRGRRARKRRRRSSSTAEKRRIGRSTTAQPCCPARRFAARRSWRRMTARQSCRPALRLKVDAMATSASPREAAAMSRSTTPRCRSSPTTARLPPRAWAGRCMRTAHSTFVKETEDFSCQVMTPEGLTVASPKTFGATWYTGLDYGRRHQRCRGLRGRRHLRHQRPLFAVSSRRTRPTSTCGSRCSATAS